MLRDLTLRSLAPSDEHALAALFAANDVEAVTRWFDPFPLDSASAHTLSNHQGRDLYWGAWQGSELAGLAMVRGWDGGHPHAAYGVMIDQGRRGQGIGLAVTRLVIDELRRLEVPELRARVHEGNAGSLRMLTAAGFEEIDRGSGRVILSVRPTRVTA
jgi:RimJ/RimL family protein N-acetyltransferase